MVGKKIFGLNLLILCWNKAMNQVKKTLYGIIEDLANHLYLLDQSIDRCTEHPAQFIQMAGELRVLITKGSDHEDLLLFLARSLKVKLEVTLSGPCREGEKITFNKYLHEKGATLNGEEFSNIRFIKFMCNSSGDFLHVRGTTDERVLFGNNINMFEMYDGNLVVGINANNSQILSIARTTSSVAHSLLEYIEKLPKDVLVDYNNKFIDC